MPKFIKRPDEVEAEQWFPGKKIAGVAEVKLAIQYSQCGAFYFISRPSCRSLMWLSVVKHLGPVPEEKKKSSGLFGSQWLEVKTGEGEIYHREAKSFTTWSIPSGVKESIGEDSDLFLDFASAHQWKVEAAPEAWCHTVEGAGAIRLAPGDWVANEYGATKVYKAEEFAARFQPMQASA